MSRTARIVGALGVAAVSGACWITGPFERPANQIATSAAHIADSVQSGATSVPEAIQQAERLAQGQVPILQRSLHDLANTAAIAANNQVQCDVDLVKERVGDSIRGLFGRQRPHPPKGCGSDPRAVVVADALRLAPAYITFAGFDLPSTGFKATVLNSANAPLKDVTASLSWNSPFAITLVFNAPVLIAISDPAAARVELSVGDTNLGQVGLVNTLPVCQDLPGTKVSAVPVSVTPVSQTHGDRDFDGHGPLVTWRVDLSIESSHKQVLQARLSFRALERKQTVYDVAQIRAAAENPRNFNRAAFQQILARIMAAGGSGAVYDIEGDDTDMLEEKTIDLYRSPEHFQIVGIESAKTSFGDDWYCTSHDVHTVYPGDPIASIDLTGDTDGDDVGRSGMKVIFGTILVHLKQTDGCSDITPPREQLLSRPLPR